MASIAALAKDTGSAAPLKLDFGGEYITLDAGLSPAAAPPAGARENPIRGSALAGGSLAVLAALWAMHFALWFMPTEGISHPLPLARFSPEAEQARIQRLANARDQSLRQVHRRVRQMDATAQAAVAPELLSVAHLLNRAVGFSVVEESPEATSPLASAGPLAAPPAAAPAPSQPAIPTPSAAAATASHAPDDALAPLFPREA